MTRRRFDLRSVSGAAIISPLVSNPKNAPSPLLLGSLAAQVLGKAVSAGAQLVLVGLLTRGLGEWGFGGYAVVVTFWGILLVMVDLGLFITGVRELSRPGVVARELLGNLLTIRLVLAGFGLGLAGMIAGLMPYESEIRGGVWLAAMGFLPYALVEGFRSCLHARMLLVRASLVDVAGALSLLLFSWLAVGWGTGIRGVSVAIAMGQAVAMLTAAMAVGPGWRPRPRWDPRIALPLLRRSAAVAASSILAAVYFRLDLLMLSVMKPLGEVAIYGAAYKLVELCVTLPGLILAGFYPLFIRAHHGPRGRLADLHDRAFLWLSLAAVPLMIGGVLTADPLSELLAGAELTSERAFDLPLLGPTALNPVAATLRTLLLAGGLMFWGQLNGHLLLATDRQARLLRLYCFVLPVNILLNLMLIPRYSYLGAAAATLGSELVALGYTTWQVRRSTGLGPRPLAVGLAVLASVPMAATVTLMPGHVLPRIAVSCLVYFLTVWVLVRQQPSGPSPPGDASLPPPRGLS